jgi:hypothetical protein
LLRDCALLFPHKASKECILNLAEEASNNVISYVEAKEPASEPFTITEEVISQAIEEINRDKAEALRIEVSHSSVL